MHNREAAEAPAEPLRRTKRPRLGRSLALPESRGSAGASPSRLRQSLTCLGPTMTPAARRMIAICIGWLWGSAPRLR